MKNEILIIGFGSGIRGDDALGPRAAELLEMRIKDEDVHVLSRPSLTPDLAQNISEAALVVFIDCAVEGLQGKVVQQDVVAVDNSTVSMVHFLDPPALLHWSNLLYGRAPKAVALSIAGASFEPSDELSASCSEALPSLIERALEIVANHLREAREGVS